MKLSVFGLLALLFLVGCGDGGGSSSSNSMPFPTKEALTAQNPSVTMDDDFTPGMGMLLVKKPAALGFCSSFLISQNHIMTNSHCLSDIIHNEDCSKNVAIHLKTSNGRQFRSCKKILTKSSITKGSFLAPDYAVIELNSPVTDAKIFKVSREGIIERDELSIESIDFSSHENWVHGRRRLSRCLPLTGAYIGNFVSAFSSIIPLFDEESFSHNCRIIKGNSGSPVFNQENQVVAVVFASADRDKAMRSLNIKNPKEVALATNIACIKIGLKNLDKDISRECEEIIRSEENFYNDMDKRLENEKVIAVQKLITDIEKNLPASFMYDLKKTSPTKSNFLISPVPSCIIHPKSWPEAELQKVTSKGFFFKKKQYSTLIPQFSQSYEVEFDEYFRAHIGHILEKTSETEIRIDDLKKLTKEGKISVKEISYKFGIPIKTSRILPLCD